MRYIYTYAVIETGQLHTLEEHIKDNHTEHTCYQLKDQEVTDLTDEEVELWQQKLLEKQDKDNEPLDTIQLDKDYNAWLSKRQMELYGKTSPNITQHIEEVLEHDPEIPDSVKEMLEEYLDSDK
tara:strand:- start:11 stop:382 length:372 start_codon:yes stop_codon:yes gene_type:complete